MLFQFWLMRVLWVVSYTWSPTRDLILKVMMTMTNRKTDVKAEKAPLGQAEKGTDAHEGVSKSVEDLNHEYPQVDKGEDAQDKVERKIKYSDGSENTTTADLAPVEG